MVFDSTKTEDTKILFNKYKMAYKGNNNPCNQKFLEHIGIPQTDFPLTTKEIECLISLSQYRNLKSAAKDLTLSPKTLETHLRNAKLKLNQKDLSSILKNFMSINYRKF